MTESGRQLSAPLLDSAPNSGPIDRETAAERAAVNTNVLDFLRHGFVAPKQEYWFLVVMARKIGLVRYPSSLRFVLLAIL